jgi:exodeoxyribonuclease VII small subunit
MTKKAQKTSIKHTNFESAVKDLEKIIVNMESGKLSLEDSLNSFEQGIAITNYCRTLLTNAEQKVQILMQEQGQQFQDFKVDLEYNDSDDQED